MLRLERERLLALLASLDDVDWVRPTPCPAWDVAGLCRHLLGDDLYVLSLVRDGHRGTNPPPGLDEAGFIAWIDRLQADWVDASRRVSPRLVVELLGWLGPHVASAFEQLDLLAVDADVSWASDRPVPQWLEAARELSEYWIHRQQLLDGAGAAAGPAGGPARAAPRRPAMGLPVPSRLDRCRAPVPPCGST